MLKPYGLSITMWVFVGSNHTGDMLTFPCQEKLVVPLIATPNDRYAKQKRQSDKESKRKETKLQGLLQKSFVYNKLDKVLCTIYLMQKLGLGIMKWMAGTVLVPTGFQF